MIHLLATNTHRNWEMGKGDVGKATTVNHNCQLLSKVEFRETAWYDLEGT